VTKYFGESWSYMTEQGQHSPTPVGSECCWCKEGFVEGEQGLGLPTASLSVGSTSMDSEILSYYHKNCFLRSLLGSVGHQRKQCSCYGGTLEDPQGLSLREAANAAVREYEEARRSSNEQCETLQ
jgi:hypothetical protein